MKNLLRIHQISSAFDDFILLWGGSILSVVLRCYVAWQFLHAGIIKLQNWPGTLELFHTEYHVPLLPPELAAWMGAGGELFFPCLLIAGFFTRPAAIGLFFVNAMAVISYPQLWDFECPAAINDHFYWGILLLVLFISGAGRISTDWLIKNKATRTSV